MKHSLHTIIAAAALALTACSNIGEDERLLPIETSDFRRNVLIEDFTGQKCVNCPKATDAINDIIKAFGEDHVIAVAIHSGPFSVTGSKGLATDFTQQYWDAWFTNEGQPIAKINRGAATNEYGNWSYDAMKAMLEETDVDIALDTKYDAAKQTVEVCAIVSGMPDEKAHLQVWLTEDGIVATQYMPDDQPAKKDYIHNHILRDALNGAWGEELTFNVAPLTKVYTYNFSDKGYVPENTHIVAFVYNDNGVQQVVKQRTVKAAAN